MPGRLFLPRWRPKGGEYRYSKVWWWEVPDGRGGKFRGSTKVSGGRPGKPPKEAQQILVQKLAEHGRGELLGPVSWEVLSALILADQRSRGLKSVCCTEDRLRHLDAFFQGRKAHEITSALITAYSAHRRAQGASVATINHSLTILGMAFNLAVRDGLISKKPIIRTLPGSNVRQGFVGDDEFEAICSGMSEPYRDVVLFLRLTGWRESEPLQLTWAQVDWTHGVRIEAGQTKRGYARTFPWYPPLQSLIEKRKAIHDALAQAGRFAHLVFCNRYGGPITRSAVYSSWQHARVRIGSRKTIHDLRRTWAREARAKGLNLLTVMELGGWRSTSMLKRYAITDLQAASREVQALSGPEPEGKLKIFSQG